MTDIEIQNIDVLEVLPQRPPFVLISRMMHYEDDSMVTQTDITPDGLPGSFSLVVTDGMFDDTSLVENIAQTCAARIGYYNKYILKVDVSIGFIGAIRQLDIHRLPQVGETIETSINILSSAFGMSLANATIKTLSGEIIAEGEMKIVTKDN